MGCVRALFVVVFILISTDVICLNKDNVYIDSLLYYLPTVSHTLSSLHQDRYDKFTSNTKHCMIHLPNNFLAQKSPCGHIQYDTENASNTKTWNITLHGGLGLNVTFTRIHLEDSLMECTSEMVSLVRQDGRGIGPYCGNKEPINSIIPEHTVAVKYVKSVEFNSRMLIHGFELEYQSHSEIMAYKSTFFYQHNKLRHTSMVPSMIPKTISDVRLLFTVVSDIYSLIQVKYNTSCVDFMVVRDGPSSQAEELPLYSIGPTEIVSNTSSAFVLLVEARYLMDKCRYKQVDLALHFLTASNPQFRKLIPERIVRDAGRIDQLTQSSRRERKIIIQGMLLTAPLGTHLELNVVEMKADGPVTSDCRYWGVVIFDNARLVSLYDQNTPLLLTDITTPLFRLCKSLLILESGTRQPVPNRYTSTTNLVVVLWYNFVPVRNKFHVTLQTKIAKCKGLFAYCGHPKYLPNKNIFASANLFSLDMFSRLSRSELDYNILKLMLPLGPGYHIPHSLGHLHVRKHRGRVFSFGVPYQDIPCLTMQYIPTYFKRREMATACNMGIVFGRQALKTKVELSYIRAFMCMNVTRIDTGMEYTVLYKIQPSCTGLTFTSSVTKYKPLMSSKDFIRNRGYGHFQSYVDEISVHYLYSLNHEFNFEGYNVSNQVIGLVHVQMTPYHNFIVNRVNSILLHSDLSKNITKIAITMENCTQACVDVLVLYEAPFNFNGVLVSNYYYQSNQLCSQDNATVEMAQYNIFSVRFIQVKQVQGTTSCRVILQINPFIRIQSLLPHIEIEEQIPRKDSITDSDDNYTMFYVLYEHSNQTWWEAQSKCEDRGGNLPSFPTAEDQNIFDHLLLGTQFNVSRNPFVTPARLYPYMGVYIGLNYTTVSKINLIIT